MIARLFCDHRHFPNIMDLKSCKRIANYKRSDAFCTMLQQCIGPFSKELVKRKHFLSPEERSFQEWLRNGQASKKKKADLIARFRSLKEAQKNKFSPHFRQVVDTIIPSKNDFESILDEAKRMRKSILMQKRGIV